MLTLALTLAFAQIHVDIQLPQIRFEVAPAVVVVSPGVQIVPDYDEEVFFVDGFYWCRRDGHWFRTRDHHGGWAIVENHVVPASIVKVPPGHYRKYKPSHEAKPAKLKGGPGKGKGGGKHKH